MCINDKYALIRMNEQIHSINVAVDMAKGNMQISFEDFLIH